MATRNATPVDILGTGLAEWFDANQGASQSGGLVPQWTGRYAGLVAAQSGSAQPGFSATARNGQPGLVFSGGQTLLGTPTGFPTGANPGTILVSGYSSASGGAFFTYGSNSDQPATGAVRSLNAGRNCTFAGQADDFDSGINGLGLDICFICQNAPTTASSIEIDVNGVSATGSIASSLTNPAERFIIGAYTSNYAYLSGTIQQIVVATRAITTTERQQLEGWESWYTGKAGSNLPANHPYKSAAPTVTTGGIIVPRRRPLFLMAS